MRVVVFIALALLSASCARQVPVNLSAELEPIAEQYVRLALALGEHDADYVDAYFGPAEWRDQARTNALPLGEISAAADDLIAKLQAVDTTEADASLGLRHNFLLTHLQSLAAVSRARGGHEFSFDEESQLIYGFVAPSFGSEHYARALEQLDAALPGEGPVHVRYREFRQQFRIPPDKVEAIVRAGIDACRKQTRQHMALPEGENFRLEFVSGEPWGAYNWYQGGAQGLIQVNMDRPRYLGTSIRLGCHEGYPGHHTFSSLLDELYLQQKGWVEFSVFPLFSPQAVIFEGSGDLAAAIAFPGDTRDAFLRDVIVPIAGNESADLDALRRIRELRHSIRYAGIEAARNYLDGDWSRADTVAWLTKYALVPPEEMDAWFGFTDRYRAYRINYVLGEDLVQRYVERQNPGGDAQGDWAALEKLLSLPPAPLLFAD